MANRALILNTWSFASSNKIPHGVSSNVPVKARKEFKRFQFFKATSAVFFVALIYYYIASERMLDTYRMSDYLYGESVRRIASVVSSSSSSSAEKESEIRTLELSEMKPIEKQVSITQQKKEQQQKQYDEPSNNISFVHYVGCCGLGHRLARMSTAYHAAQSLNYALKGTWHSCQKTNVFEHLFDPENWTMLSYHHTTELDRSGKRIKFNNEVPGYITINRISNQNIYPKSHRRQLSQIPLNTTTTIRNGLNTSSNTDTFASQSCYTCHPKKIKSDYEFYIQLLDRFKKRDQVKEFRIKHAFHNHTVIGMHIRAGNGEGGDFANKDRGIDNTTHFVHTVSQHVLSMVEQQKWKNPPLLFLATDTPTMIDLFRQKLKQFVPVIELPQIRPEDGEGILFGERRRKREYLKYQQEDGHSAAVDGTDDEYSNEDNNYINDDAALQLSEDDKDESEASRQACLLGWDQAFMDMMLLAFSDIVLATRRSSFVQTIPMSVVTGKPRKERKVAKPYCEISEDETLTMTCHETYMDWCCCSSCVNWPGVDDIEKPPRRSHEYIKQLRPDLWDTPAIELYQNKVKKQKKKRRRRRPRTATASMW